MSFSRLLFAAIFLGTSTTPTFAYQGHHHAAAPQTPDPAVLHRTRGPFLLPDVQLIDRHGRPFDLRRQLQGHSLVLQFIFTSCTTICPVLSAALAAAQDDLARLDPGVRLVSISIDPEHDTPEVLAAFARDLGAGPHWRFLTGSPDDIMRVLKAFAAWYPAHNKMYHRPYTFIHVAGSPEWIRLDGLPGKAPLLAEYRRALAGRPSRP